MKQAFQIYYANNMQPHMRAVLENTAHTYVVILANDTQQHYIDWIKENLAEFIEVESGLIRNPNYLERPPRLKMFILKGKGLYED